MASSVPDKYSCCLHAHSALVTIVDVKGVQASDGVVLTTAGKLSVKHIIHMVGQTKEKEITYSMYKVLKKCEENKIQSVSFPALGTGKYSHDVFSQCQ